MRALAPRMIGRRSQLQELEEHLRQVRAGSGRLVLLAGEAGAGKTRLVRAFLEQAHAQAGVEVLQGSCYEQEPAVPYGPFLDILGALLRTHPPEAVLAAAGPLSGELVALLPELAPLLPELAPLAPVPTVAGDPQSQKRRLFDALYRVLRPQGGGHSRILVLEDLHWADQTSQELLHYLVRASQRDPLLILGTYRTDELHRRHPLTHFLAQLTRERAYHELRIAPLSQPELAQMLEATLDRKVPAAFVTALADRTGGNPFFVEEILRALLDQAQLDTVIQASLRGGASAQLAIPLSIKDSIQRRTADLDATMLEVLQYAAVIGRRFEFELRLRLTGLGEAGLVRAIERLVERQLVAEEPGAQEDRYGFRHALSREAVYEDLLGRSRRLKHRAVLQALEELHPANQEPVLDQLAYHSLQAREEAKAAHYARLAGDRSARMFAFREALGHYQTALELLEAADPRERAELLEKLAEVAYPLGDAVVYERCWQEVLQLYEQLGDRRKVGVLSRRLGLSYQDRNDHEAALVSITAAWEVLEAEPPGHELAMAYAALAQQYANMARPQESIAWGAKALRLADDLGDDEVQVIALVYIGESLSMLGELQRAVEYLERSLEAAKRAAVVKETLNAYQHLGMIFVDLGEYRRAAGLLGEGMALARQHGWEVRMSGDCGCALGFAELELGWWAQAHETLDRAIGGEELGHPWWVLCAMEVKGELLLRQGRPEEARRLLEGILPAYEPRDWLTQMGAILARIRLALADGEGALAAMEQWVETWRTAGSPARWECALARGVEVYLGVGRPERASEVLCELSASAERSATRLAQAALADAQGLMAVHEGRHVEAAAHFRQAAALWHAMEASYLEAHARRLDAESLLQSGDRSRRAEATGELATAQAICASLGAPLELAAIADTMLRHGLAPQPVQPAIGQTDGLTRREREVLALIARGYSNRAIASALVITEKTVETHVSNILGKLGCTSRAQAAAYAVEHGLAAGATP
jgi:DNA-binding NarL/FixJ family response regulator